MVHVSNLAILHYLNNHEAKIRPTNSFYSLGLLYFIHIHVDSRPVHTSHSSINPTNQYNAADRVFLRGGAGWPVWVLGDVKWCIYGLRSQPIACVIGCGVGFIGGGGVLSLSLSL